MNTGSNALRVHLRLRKGVLLLTILALIVPLMGMSAAAQDADPLATRVQFLHGATDLGEVEIHLNGAGELDEFGYGDLSDWITVDPGTVRLTITRDRAGFNYAVFDGVYPVPAGNDYYVVISDALILAGAFDTSPVAAGNGRVQVTHASADTPEVNIVVSGTDMTIPISYPRTSDAVELPAGTYDLDIQLAETGESLAMVTGFTVEAGTSYQFVAVGDPTSDDKPLEVKVLQTATSSASEATPAA